MTGKQLREIRKKLGLGQWLFGQAVGIDRWKIQLVESGSRTFTDKEKEKLKNYLKSVKCPNCGSDFKAGDIPDEK